jgi:SAM-dependent methyltransferase
MRYFGLKRSVNLSIFKFCNRKKEKFECPICGYSGPFMDVVTAEGPRKHAKCPNCTASERHRIQFVVLQDVLRDRPTTQWKMLHVAPEPFFREFFSQRFDQYETADFKMKGVDHAVDLRHLPFGDHTYDFVFASHVLEHIPDDHKAISEIRRILKPNGMAILPVPIYSAKTIEYPEPNPHEFFHVRAPGTDYFDRYEPHFSKVDRFSSGSLPEKYQLFVYEDHSHLSAKEHPWLSSVQGDKFSDWVPVCYV